MDNFDALIAALNQPVEQLTYEQAVKQLEEIVAALETSGYSLDLSLQLFERGQALARYCSDLLEKAELKVKQLSGEMLTDFAPPD
jgi:exodeoxyribonuclease VII small subunit